MNGEGALRALLDELAEAGQRNDARETERSRRLLSITPETGELLGILVCQEPPVTPQRHRAAGQRAGAHLQTALRCVTSRRLASPTPDRDGRRGRPRLPRPGGVRRSARHRAPTPCRAAGGRGPRFVPFHRRRRRPRRSECAAPRYESRHTAGATAPRPAPDHARPIREGAPRKSRPPGSGRRGGGPTPGAALRARPRQVSRGASRGWPAES